MQLFLIAICFPILGGLIAGFNSTSFSSASLYIKSQLHMGPQALETAISSKLWAATVAAMLVTWLVGKFGRKYVMIFGSALMLTGTSLDFFVEQAFTLDLTGWLMGFGFGITNVVIYLYVSEMVAAPLKGKLLVAYSAMTYTGILLCDIIDVEIAKASEWHWMVGIVTFPTILQIILLLFVPESTVWLKQKSEPTSTRLSLREQFQNLFPTSKHSLYFAFGLILAAIASAIGISTLFNYSGFLFMQVGFQSETAAVEALTVTALVQAVASLATILFIERFRRKTLISFGLFGTAVSLLLISLSVFYFKDSELLPRIFFGLINILAFVYTIGFVSVVWVAITEIFSTRTRSLGLAVATVVFSLMFSIVTNVYLTIIEDLGIVLTFGLFSAITFVSFLFVRLFLPETKELGEEW